jgi:hypothetical protein
MPDTQADMLSMLKAQFQALDPQLPLALFPLRVQVRFATPRMVAALATGNMQVDLSGDPPSELWVRIYPDDIFVHAHEHQLNEQEATAAELYWEALWQSIQAGHEPEARRLEREGAWKALAEDFGPVRARWILQQTEPPAGLDNEGFPTAPPQLPNLELTQDSWNQAPRTYLLPSRFLLRLEQGGNVREYAGHPIQKEDGALILGIDPNKDEEFEDTPTGRQVPEEMRWLLDFQKAVEIGMGLRIPLSPEEQLAGFDRLYVLGWHRQDDTTSTAELLESLFENHRYKPGGMDLIAPGTPTNNTREDSASSGPDEISAEESFALAEVPDGDDARRLARALGLPESAFSGLDHSQLSAVQAGLDIHGLLFEATLGQALAFWHRPLSNEARQQLQDYMSAWVSGRGLLPTLRIDTQPYAFLPALPFSRFKADPSLLGDDFLRQLWVNILSPLDDWFAGQMGRVPQLHHNLQPEQVQPTFLSILQMHPGSVDYRQRFALDPEFFKKQENELPDALKPLAGKTANGLQFNALRNELNAIGFPLPDGLERLFFDREAHPLVIREGIGGESGTGPAAAPEEDVLLGMEGNIIPPLGNSEENYLQWLASANLDDIRQEENLPGGEPPYAVLYRLLRYRLLQSGGSTAVREGIAALINLPAGELKKLVQEHLDCCTYRLDAWIGGLAGKRLAELRQARPDGLHLGAWGYLENLRPAGSKLQRGEYIPAPSLRHATAAALLRSGFQANRFSGQSENEGLFAVNLNSNRVKSALFLIEGVRNGQDLAALLGYHLERSMREYQNEQGVPILASLIYDLRQKYPFKVTPLVQTGQSAPTEIEEDFTQHVINALDLLKDRENWQQGLAPAPTTSQISAMASLLHNLDDELDSVKDLLAAEGVYQLVDGQMDRAQAALDALTEGEQLITPEIAKIPRSSMPLTFRLGALLPDSPLATTGSAPPSPRALAGAKANRWLFDKLPDLSFIWVRVRWQAGENAEGEPVYAEDNLPLRHLLIEPIDLAYMMHLQRENPDASELRYRIERVIRQRHNLPLTTRIEILDNDRTGFREREYTLFAVEPLAAGLGKLLLETRRLGPEDFLQANDEAREQAGQFWAPAFQLRQLRNVALQMEGNHEVLTNRLAQAQARLDSGGQLDEAQLERDLHHLREGMFFYAGLGWIHAVPTQVEALNRLVLEQHCRRASQILQEAASKMEQARELLAPGSPLKLSELLNIPSTRSPQENMEALVELTALLFGRFYQIYPDFRLPNAAALGKALQSPALQASKAGFALERWIQTLAPVRPNIDLYQHSAMLSDLFGRAENMQGFGLAQLPLREEQTGPWVGQEYGDFEPHPDTLSLTLELHNDFSLNHNTFSGILIDEWQELVPDPTANVGIALQYDQPDTEAPNAVLLALTPSDNTAWDWENLVQTVADTMMMAKKRAIDPDLLKESFWDQLLPSLLGPIYTGQAAESENTLNFGSLPGQTRVLSRPSLELSELGLNGLDLGNIINPEDPDA